MRKEVAIIFLILFSYILRKSKIEGWKKREEREGRKNNTISGGGTAIQSTHVYKVVHIFFSRQRCFVLFSKQSGGEIPTQSQEPFCRYLLGEKSIPNGAEKKRGGKLGQRPTSRQSRLWKQTQKTPARINWCTLIVGTPRLNSSVVQPEKGGEGECFLKEKGGKVVASIPRKIQSISFLLLPRTYVSVIFFYIYFWFISVFIKDNLSFFVSYTLLLFSYVQSPPPQKQHPKRTRWILGRIGREPPGVLFLPASRLIAFAIHRPSSFSSSFSLLLSMAQNGFCYSSFFDGRFFRCMKTFVLAFANPHLLHLPPHPLHINKPRLGLW